MNELQLNKIDYVVIGIYSIFGIGIALIYTYELLPQEKINTGMLAFGLGGSLLLFGLYYKRLRFLSVTAIWSLLAVTQVVIYLLTKSNSAFNNAIGGTYLKSLLYLPLFLIVFSTLRFIYKLIFNQELVITSTSIRPGEIVENRKLLVADFIFSIIGIMLIIFGLDFLKI